MIKKLTIEFIRGEFKKEGYILLSKNYVNAHQKLEYICPEGHQESICWNNWQQGQRCSECFGSKKLTIEFIKKEFEKEGYTLLTKEYINSKRKLKYICPKGHIYRITWDAWKQGCRCMECSGSKKLTIEFIKKEFEKERYSLLTIKYINRKGKLKCICPKGHHRVTTWSEWLRGQRCRKCYLEYNKGKNHYRWDSNLMDVDRQDRRLTLGYKEWVYKVKGRDGFICQVCGQVGRKLVSHHLESYNKNPNLRTFLDNGVCLCEKCHNNFHYQYGRGNNTRKQFIEFINNYNRQEKLANV